MNYQIIAVYKPNGHIYGVECSDGSCFTKKSVILKILSGDFFETKDRYGNTAKVILDGPFSTYIKTAADGTTTDNLGNLPISNKPLNCFI